MCEIIAFQRAVLYHRVTHRNNSFTPVFKPGAHNALPTRPLL